MSKKNKIFIDNLSDICVEDFMTKNTVSVRPEISFNELIQIFVDNKISGVPVVNDEGKLEGIVSKSDIVSHNLEKDLRKVLKKVVDIVFDSTEPENLKKKFPKTLPRKVENIMTTNVITANPKTSIIEIASIMLKNKIHRIVITENEKVVGIVTAMDILSLFYKGK